MDWLERMNRAIDEIMYECLKSIGGYELDFNGRNFIEEHVFSIDWFGGADEKVDSNCGCRLKNEQVRATKEVLFISVCPRYSGSRSISS